MARTAEYRLIDGPWGIAIDLRAECVAVSDPSSTAVRVTDNLWLDVAVGWQLSDEESDYLRLGLELVADAIERSRDAPIPLLIHVTSLDFNPTDYSPEGLVPAIALWAATEFHFAVPKIPVSFDKIKNRYVFGFERVAAPPDSWPADVIAAMMSHVWTEGYYRDASESNSAPLRDARKRGITSNDFFISPDLETANSTQHRRSFRCLVKETRVNRTRKQSVAFVFEERTGETDRLLSALRDSLWANEMSEV